MSHEDQMRTMLEGAKTDFDVDFVCSIVTVMKPTSHHAHRCRGEPCGWCMADERVMVMVMIRVRVRVEVEVKIKGVVRLKVRVRVRVGVRVRVRSRNFALSFAVPSNVNLQHWFRGASPCSEPCRL
jgi:hypothetical protein